MCRGGVCTRIAWGVMSCKGRREACGFHLARGRAQPQGPEGDWQEVAHLTPHEHVSKHDLQSIEEVVADDNDSGAACGPALPGADGLDAGGGSWEAGEEPGQGLEPRWTLGAGWVCGSWGS